MAIVQDPEMAGLVDSAQHAIREALRPVVEEKLKAKDGVDWLRLHRERRRAVGAGDVRFDGEVPQWDPYTIIKSIDIDFVYAFKGAFRKEGKSWEQIQGVITLLAPLRNLMIGHPTELIDEERAFLFLILCHDLFEAVGIGEYTKHMRSLLTRFRELQRRPLRRKGPQSESPPSPIAVLGPNAAIEEMLREYPADLAEQWRAKAIDGAIEIFSCPSATNPYGGFDSKRIICEIENKEWPDGFGGLTEHQSNELAVALVGDRQQKIAGWLTQKSSPGRIRTLAAPIGPPVLDRQEVYLRLANSDYFSVRTITELRRLNREGRGPSLQKIFPIRWGNPKDTFTTDCIPYHISVQGVVVCRSEEDEYLILGRANPADNKITGGWGATMAEQMWAPERSNRMTPWWAPFVNTTIKSTESRDGDADLRETLRRGLWEEMRIRLGVDTLDEPLLLNAAIEQDMYFVTFIFLVSVALTPAEIYDRWMQAPDRNEMGLLAAYQLCGRDDTGAALDGPRRLAELLRSELFDAGPHLLPQSRDSGQLVGPWHCSSRLRMYAAGMHFWPEEFQQYVRLA